MKKYFPCTTLALLSILLIWDGARGENSACAAPTEVIPLTSQQISALARNTRKSFIRPLFSQKSPFLNSLGEVTISDASLSDALLSIAEASDKTIIVDASRLSKKASLSYDHSMRLDQLWGLLEHNFDLLWEQRDTNTIIVSKAPPAGDTLRVARQLLETGEKPTVPTDPVPAQLLSSASIYELAKFPGDPLAVSLSNYLREEGIVATANYSKDLPISTLPPALRDRVLARVRALSSSKKPDYSLWLGDGWGKGRLTLSKPVNADLTNPAQLIVSGVASNRSGGTAFGLPAVQRNIRESTADETEAQADQPVVLESNGVATTPPEGQPGIINLRARHAPLTEFVKELAKQGGVVLQLDADVANLDAQVTARIHNLPIEEVLASLSRLYRLSWKRQENGSRFASLVPQGSTVDGLVPLGNPSSVIFAAGRVLYDFDHPTENGASDIALRIVRQIGEQTLLNAKKKGVPFSSLPENLQQEIKTHLQSIAALDNLQGYLNTNGAQWNDAVLHVQNAPLTLTDEDAFSLVATLRLPNSATFIVSAPPESLLDASLAKLSEEARQEIISAVRQQREIGAKVGTPAAGAPG